MTEWPLTHGQLLRTVGANTTTSGTTVITAGAVANTKGAWVEITPSTPVSSSRLSLIGVPHADNREYLIDLAIGASGAEQTIVTNLGLENGGTLNVARRVEIPLAIPAGVRLAARQQCTSAQNMSLEVVLETATFGAPSPSYRVATYGANTADSGGVSVDPGAVANTKGAWVEITSSTSGHHRWMLVYLGNQTNTIRTTADWLLDIGIGAAGAEQTIIANHHVIASASGDAVGPIYLGPFALDLPPGVRLSARSQCSITDATDRLFDVIIYGGH